MAVSDDELAGILEQARAGRVDAWSRLIVEFGPMVSAYARAVAFSDPEAEVSDIFEEAAQGVDCFEGGRDDFCTFLFDIAVSHRRAADSPSSGRAPAHGEAPVPEIARLHPDIRDAVLLARIAQIPPAAIADILEVDRSVILDWQRQGLDALGR
jgi:DNA-directed RNA polymerase specialized sigma24 family protein